MIAAQKWYKPKHSWILNLDIQLSSKPLSLFFFVYQHIAVWTKLLPFAAISKGAFFHESPVYNKFALVQVIARHQLSANLLP